MSRVLVPLFCLAVLVAFAGCSALAPRSCPAQNTLRVAFLNVGQGDAIMIQCPEGGAQTLIDAGEGNDRYPEAEEMFLAEFFKIMGRDRILEHAINTHPHSDHLYGFLNLLQGEKHNSRVSVSSYYDQGVNNQISDLEETIRQTVIDNGGKYIRIGSEPIDTIALCPGHDVQLHFISPDSEQSKLLNCPDNLNDCSLILRLEHGDNSFLFTADATTGREQSLLQDKSVWPLLSATVLKIGHHGSGSSSAPFISIVNPKFAILSVGHPGIGTTTQHFFPEVELVKRFSEHFQRNGPTGAHQRRTLRACGQRDNSCEWQDLLVPRQLLSTADVGTITFHLREGQFCVETESEGVVLDIYN